MKPKFHKATAVGLLLAGRPSLASPLNATALAAPLNSTVDTDTLSLHLARSGCHQSDCPDTRFGVDIISMYTEPFRTWLYFLRWQSVCGCHKEQVFADGCRSFTTCTGRHSVCFDWHGGRGHWIDPSGHKTCWYLSSDYICRQTWLAWPKIEVACTW
ncbi:hypothetical protein LMH87_001649 [Akanthomyces muscarius]|uniref:Secreted protein n=1 Tax=Akanthomyces muscarius TaxID=2231603 RepID=A0A9W8Q5J0_AKAMU|nr:hypothetical protein LMH87_001649 [Akanthomyces muscarius]KAJ4147102.1 hypothetical protein LMH87_001649 [Akanthomyces muscarius]